MTNPVSNRDHARGLLHKVLNGAFSKDISEARDSFAQCGGIHRTRIPACEFEQAAAALTGVDAGGHGDGVRIIVDPDKMFVPDVEALEIFANDVKCTHGAAVGQLDEEALFYLRSRGLGERTARRLLTHAVRARIEQLVNVRG